MNLLFLESQDIWMWVIIAGILIVGILGYLLIKHYTEKIAPKRKIKRNSQEHSIRVLKKVLSGYVRKYEGRVIYSIDLASSKTSGSADAILIGWFGALVLVGCDYSGDLYVDDAKAASMTQIVKTEREKHDNPFLQASKAAKAVNEMLREKKVYRVPVESAVVFTGSGAKPNIPPSIPHFTPKQLKKALSGGRFIEDKGVDADKVAEAILSWR